jgi:hypothetical protein
MAHDKIKAAARRRMAETGESCTAARREVRAFRCHVNGAAEAGLPPAVVDPLSIKDKSPPSMVVPGADPQPVF